MAYAFGGIIGCGSAFVIEIVDLGQSAGITTKVDPNIYFAIYTVLILALFVVVIRMNSSLEPEIVLQQREAEFIGDEA